VLLARGKDQKAEAMAAYHKLMLLGGEALSQSKSLPIATLCDLFLDFSEVHQSPDAYKNYKHFLQAFCKEYGTLSVADIKPFHVNRWIDDRKSWKGAKRHAIISVKRTFSWGEQQGLIQSNPLRTLKAPRGNRRERVLTADERTLILESVKDRQFRDFLTAMLGTGCRPSEVANVTAADVKLEIGVWVLMQHKTVKKTGKPRVIYLSPDMLELTKRQMEKFPTGPLFPNMRGKVFSRNAWRCRFRRLREKFPSLAGVVCYSLRHSFATDALVKGVGIAQVAELMGHTSTEMVSRVYGHIAANVAHMRDAAKKATE
jgi:integrase